MPGRGWLTPLILLAVLLAGCAGSPAPIRYGEESCGFCRMAISDPRFGAQLVTSKGRTHAFDSIECLVSFHLARPGGEAPPRTLLVSDYAHPGEMIPALDAVYLRDARLHSPMGFGLIAVESLADAREIVGDDVAPLTWAEVVELVRSEGEGAGAHPHLHAASAAPGGDGR